MGSFKRKKAESKARQFIDEDRRHKVLGSKEFYQAVLATQLEQGIPEGNCTVCRRNPRNDFWGWYCNRERWGNWDFPPQGWIDFKLKVPPGVVCVDNYAVGGNKLSTYMEELRRPPAAPVTELACHYMPMMRAVAVQVLGWFRSLRLAAASPNQRP